MSKPNKSEAEQIAMTCAVCGEARRELGMVLSFDDGRCARVCKRCVERIARRTWTPPITAEELKAFGWKPPRKTIEN